MMTQIDELYKKRHLEMSYIEFLEAMVRVCDMANIPENPITEDGLVAIRENVGTYPLTVKVLNAMKLIIRLCPKYI